MRRRTSPGKDFTFTPTRDSYVEGMRLSVVLPYHSLNDSRNREYIGQVVRVETLSNGQFGVAIDCYPLRRSPASRDNFESSERLTRLI